ncbi:AT-rich interactive domain-containing protein 3-like isoform X3 [Rhododendron vialii]|uniref:AT-rich interactive domain-containing protein 3-like isoform X3 n=1 Tax=Rhododendron vialii TaxID=182163 RepID=UPI00265F4D42|nr:AT-rich interactive domain-containing protein 3-like isoform X3 [Rhododendron vialii]
MVKVTDEHDGVSNDIAVEDTEVEKDESTYLGDKDSTHSTDRLAGNKESLQSDYANVGNKECVLPHHIQNPIATARLHPEDDLEHPDVRSLELPKEGSSLEEKSLIEPSAVDPANNASPNEPQDRNEKFEDMHLDPPIQSDSIRLVEMSVKTQADDEIGKELKRGLTVMELDEGIAAKEDELNYGEMRAEFLPEHETKDHESNSEELNVGVTDLELPQNTGTKEEELDDVMTGTELTPDNGIEEESNGAVMGKEVLVDSKIKNESRKDELDVGVAIEDKSSNRSFLLESNDMADEWGTEEEQAAFMRELETFHKERFLEFKPPRFYGEPLNCLKLWRAVIRLGGYEQVTSCKYWRQVGESFKPPKTCTTVSWTFRCFYEKALLEYEKHKMRSGELPFTDASFTEPASAGNLDTNALSVFQMSSLKLIPLYKYITTRRVPGTDTTAEMKCQCFRWQGSGVMVVVGARRDGERGGRRWLGLVLGFSLIRGRCGEAKTMGHWLFLNVKEAKCFKAKPHGGKMYFCISL